MLSLKDIGRELGDALGNLWVLADVVQYARVIGYDFSQLNLGGLAPPVTALLNVVENLKETLAELEALDDADGANAVQLTQRLVAVVKGVVAAQTQLELLAGALNDNTRRATLEAMVPGGDAADFVEEFAARSLGWLVVSHLEARHPVLLGALRVAGVIRITRITGLAADADLNRVAFRECLVDFAQLGAFIEDPKAAVQTAFAFGTDFATQALLESVQSFLLGRMVPAALIDRDVAALARFEAMLSATFDAEATSGLTTTLWSFPPLGASLSASLLVLPRAQAADPNAPLTLPGIGLVLALTSANSLDVQLTESTTLKAGLGGPTEARAFLAFVPGRPPEFDYDLPANGPESLALTLKSAPSRASPQKVVVLGEADGNRLEIGGVGVTAGFELKRGAAPHIFAEGTLYEGRIVVDTTEGDGFIELLLPALRVDASFEITVGVDSQGRLYFKGSGGVEIAIPIHANLGPVRLEILHLVLTFGDQGSIPVELSVTAAAKLGPLTVAVQRIGALFNVTFPGKGGNLGALDVATSFKPPTGAGLSVDSAGITGGGFLELDNDAGRYAGVLGLKFGELGLTAVGLITTRPTVSTLVNIGVLFNPPVPMSFGFTLMGVGGLIGLNRDVLVSQLQSGLKDHTLDAVLFPDPATVVENASRILSDLDRVFPATPGRHVVGPMVKLGWGSPTLVTADIGIFLTLPDPVLGILLGQVSATLPTAEAPAVVLNLDVLGVFDPAKKLVTFQAALHDSRVLTYTLLGDSALLLRYSDPPDLALAIGGFHPKFDPPAPPSIFSGLERLTLQMGKGDKFQVACRGYLAVTTNSLQLGARIDVDAKSNGAELHGDLGFDCLVVLRPFSLEASISGGVNVRYRGRGLADVRLQLTLTGPTPWRARGKASFELLAWDVDVDFNFKWGSDQERSVPGADPWPQVVAAFSRAPSWGTVLPRGSAAEQLKSRTDGDDDLLVVHPAGSLEVRQRVAPLDLTLSRLGSAPVLGHDRISVPSITAGHLGAGGQFVSDEPGGAPPAPQPVLEFFARGQSESLSNQQKLSLPSFEKLTGGVRTARADQAVVGGAVESIPLEYESILLGQDLVARRQLTAGRKPFAGEGAHLLERPRTARQSKGIHRFATGAAAKVGVDESTWAIVERQGLTLVGPEGLSRMAADQLLVRRLAEDPGRAGNEFVVPSYEVQLP